MCQRSLLVVPSLAPVEASALPRRATLCSAEPHTTSRCSKKKLGTPGAIHEDRSFTEKPGAEGSGLEHEDSTLILLTDQLPSGKFGDDILWSVVAHEYMHLWTAERIKVESLMRPDYTRPVDTSTLWVNEGITEYFTQHILLRAGLKDREGFFLFFSSTAASARRTYSPTVEGEERTERACEELMRMAAGVLRDNTHLSPASPASAPCSSRT